jgi:hemoglobin
MTLLPSFTERSRPKGARFAKGAGIAALLTLAFATGPATSADKPLFERLGGVYGIAGAVDDLVNRLYVNGTLNANPAIKAIHDQHGQAGFKYLVTAFSIEATGGPKAYIGRPMDQAHAHLNITNREFDVVETEIKTSLYKFNVPPKEFDEFMAIIESYRTKVVTATN